MTHKDIIRQVIASRDELVHGAADDLEMIQHIPNVHFGHWRKEAVYRHWLFPRYHPILIGWHARDPAHSRLHPSTTIAVPTSMSVTIEMYGGSGTWRTRHLEVEA
jgi:hypothetical protein